MATGDDAAAAGFPLVSSTDKVKDGYTQHNLTRDIIAQRTSTVQPVTKGGTGATTAAAARTNLGAAATTHMHDWEQVTGKPSVYTPAAHTHDDRYFTESEVNSLLSGKANSSHTHTKAQITDFAHTHDDRYFTESESDARYSASVHTHAYSAITGKPSSFPNDDVSAATSSATPDTLVRRSGGGAIAVSLGGDTSAVPKNYCDDNRTTSASALTSGTLSRPVSTSGSGRFGGAWDNNITSTRRSMWMESDGTLGHTSSSARYKKDINPWEGLTNEQFAALRVVTFRWRAAVADAANPDAVEVGVIAEELHELGMTWAVFYDDEGRPEGVHYEYIALALIPRLQDVETRLAAIEDRLAALE